MKRKIKLLDCTLRDGGYYNSWDFNKTITKNYFEVIKNNSQFDACEIGFRFLQKDYYLGPYAFSSDEYLKKRNYRHKNLAIMINGSDILEIKKGSKIEKLKNFFKNKKSRSLVKIVRVAIHPNQLRQVMPYLRLIKNLGYQVFLNIMQITSIENKKFKKLLNFLSNKIIDVVYIADSFGNLNPELTKNYCQILKKNWNGEFGIHAHDNQGLANKNSLTAIKYGATWIDSTIMGMGRGAGNAQTEKILKLLNKDIKKDKKKFSKLLKEFSILKKKYQWGKSDLYNYASKNFIHPTYVQNLLKQIKSNKEIREILKNLSKFDCKKYEINFLNKILNQQKISKDFKISNNSKYYLKYKGKTALILANGQSLRDYVDYLPIIKKKFKPIIFSLNFINYVPKQLIDFYIFSNYEKILSQRKYIKKMNKSFFAPYSRIKQISDTRLNNHNHINFNIKNVHSDYFFIEKNGCTLPNNLAFSYNCAIAKYLGINNIFLMGFDGEQDAMKFHEMSETIKLVSKNRINLVSLSKTNYPLKTKSIFSLI